MTKGLALGYVRVSTNRQEATGHSLEKQAQTLIAAAQAEGYEIELITEVSSGRNSARPQLKAALAKLNSGEAKALFAVDTDRLSRSLKHLCQLLEDSEKHSWRLVLTATNIDTNSPAGRLVLATLGAAAQYETEMTSMRVKRQHEARRARGITWGVDQGFRGNLPGNVRGLIAKLHNEGASLRKIIAELEARDFQTPTGAQWWPTSIKAILESPQTRPLLDDTSEAA